MGKSSSLEWQIYVVCSSDECLKHLDQICGMAIRNYGSPVRDFIWFFLFIFFCCFSINCHAVNIIRQGEVIRDGETIISERQIFELGFFSPGDDSTLRYVGIWYYGIPIPSAIWVANRDKPISGDGGVLTVGNDGNLTVLDGNGTSVWSTNASYESSNSTAILNDSGDLILSRRRKLHEPEHILWQSFNNPTDSYLPGMRVDINARNGEYRVFTSWKSASDPSPGNYSMGIDPHLSPQIVIWQGQNRRWRSGHWTGLIFTGVPDMRSFYLYGFDLIIEEGRTYFIYTPANGSDFIRFLISWNGIEEQLRWDGATKNWSTIQTKPSTECEFYNKCGVFGKCNAMKSPICSCIEGFEPIDFNQWSHGNWSGGCHRKKPLMCGGNHSITEEDYGEKDEFVKIEGVKMPDYLDSLGTEDKNECEEKCLKNCSCTAYASVSGLNCMIWTGNLIDIEQFAEGGNTLYIRLAHSELGGGRGVSTVIVIALVVVGSCCLIVAIWLFMRFSGKLKVISNWWRKKNEGSVFEASRSWGYSTEFSGQDGLNVEGQQGTAPELAIFSFSSVATATNNFSDENKLGQGGFGPVYKGQLPGGEEIAVKRLSRISGQGLEELKNEITLIAKLQHRNLVRLLGCCIEREEKMLLYEYMPNKSLDLYLFDSSKQAQLDWKKRFTIIEGIARGLLYLHRDSRLRIIHRDLKAGNILLDDEMNPKISDFGMARIFGRNQNEANTVRVVGTYGYMSPEYAMEGLFSVKSDVYSFGVLLLEIVSGRRNGSFRTPEHSNIIGYAWDLWDRGKALELIDPSIASSCCPSEVLKCIHLGMLCVQDMASHRPNMSTVVLMLEGESVTLPIPTQPTFTSMRSSVDRDFWNGSHEPFSSNNVTISVIVGR